MQMQKKVTEKIRINKRVLEKFNKYQPIDPKDQEKFDKYQTEIIEVITNGFLAMEELVQEIFILSLAKSK